MDESRILKEGFAQFVTAARELEAGYAALKQRAAAVDLQLQASNRALQQSLAEREAMFSALPIGVVALRADGTMGSSNREAERLLVAGQAAGVDLLQQRGGEVAFAEWVVRVQRVDLPQLIRVKIGQVGDHAVGHPGFERFRQANAIAAINGNAV